MSETQTKAVPPPPRPPKRTAVATDSHDRRLTYLEAREILARLGLFK